MAYSPGTVSSGDLVNKALIEARVDAFRSELNNGSLDNDDISAGNLTADHVERPTLESISGREWEWRGASGGMHYFTKEVANLVCVEDDSVLNSSTKGNTSYQLASPSGKPENGGLNTILHKYALNELTNFEKMIPVPDCGVSVRINQKCEVYVRVKTIFNNLLNNTIGNSTGTNLQSNNNQDEADGTGRVFLLHKSPDGVIQKIGTNFNGAGMARSFLLPTQHHLLFRDNHLMGKVVIDADDEMGEHHFFLAGCYFKYTTNGTIDKYPIHMSLQGRTEFQVEWFNFDD